MILGVSGNSKRARSVADLWLTKGKREQSFVRRQSTEPLSLVFSSGYLPLPSPCFGDNLVHSFVSSNNCRK